MPSAIAIKQVPGKPGQVYYPLEKITIPDPKPTGNEVRLLHPFTTSPNISRRLSSPSAQPP